MGDKIRAHSYAVIHNLEKKMNIARCGLGKPMDSQCHFSALSGIFDGIVQQIAQHLIQAQLITNQTLLGNTKSIDLQRLPFLLRLRLKYESQLLKQFRKGEG